MYRRKMHVSYWEAMMTPRDVMMNDLEMMDLEATYSREPEQT